MNILHQKNHWIQQHESGLKHSSEIIKQKKKTVSSMGTSHNLDERIRAQRWQVPPNSAIMLETVFSHQLGAGCRSLQRVFRLFFLHDHYCSQTTKKTTTKTTTETELLHRHVLDWKALLMRRRSDSSSIITLFLNQTHTHTLSCYIQLHSDSLQMSRLSLSFSLFFRWVCLCGADLLWLPPGLSCF